jgi:uncharacterized protein (TIGR03435 family)
MLKTAYGVSLNEQVRGGPQWISSTRFDVQAVAAGASQEKMRLMLRRLLQERFRLNAKVVPEDFPALALTLKRADRLGKAATVQVNQCQSESAKNTGQSLCGEILLVNNAFIAKSVSMNRIAEVLSRSPTLIGGERVVVDRTGLAGFFSFEVKFARSARPGINVPDFSGLAEFTTALEEQLGLALEPTRVPIDVFVISNASMPEPD